MLSITSYTKIGMRMAIFAGGIISLISFIIGLVYLVMKLIYWDRFTAGMAPITIGMVFPGRSHTYIPGLDWRIRYVHQPESYEPAARN